MKTKVIAICNNKGGVGKTTTAANTAAALVALGYKVLAVDLDAQTNLTYCLTPEDFSDRPTVADALKGGSLPVYKLANGIDLAPASFALNSTEPKGTKALKSALEQVKESYDFVIIDTAPGVGLLTLNALNASDGVIITLTAEALPTKGMQNFEAIVAAEGSSVIGYLVTRYNSRLSLAREIMEALRVRLGAKLFSTVIRENVALAEAPFSRSHIFDYSAKSNGAKDYAQFAKELKTKI